MTTKQLLLVFVCLLLVPLTLAEAFPPPFPAPVPIVGRPPVVVVAPVAYAVLYPVIYDAPGPVFYAPPPPPLPYWDAFYWPPAPPVLRLSFGPPYYRHHRHYR